MQTMPKKPISIVVIEDNSGDAQLFELLFSNCSVPTKVTVLTDGNKAEDYLFQKAADEAHHNPTLILLDLNVPYHDGRMLLKKIKNHDQLCVTPVVVISTSNSPSDVREAYCMGASAFITKPLDLDQFQLMINSLAEFWFYHAQLCGK